MKQIALLPLVSMLLPAVVHASAARGVDRPTDPRLKLELRRAGATSQHVSMFVKTADVAATTARVKALGGKVRTVAGDVLTVSVPRDQVSALHAAPSVRGVEAPVRLRPRLDRSLPDMNVPDVHAGASPLPAAYDGADVLVGVIDFGLDFEHAAFKRGDGSSRVIALWDQGRTDGVSPEGYDYGALCTAQDIDDGKCKHAEPEAHGSHVTGIAAGTDVDGLGGVAPGADIAFVHLAVDESVDDVEEALSTSLCDAAAFIFDVAQAQGKPAVINMSLGHHGHPHDGMTLADECLENLTGPGRILVAAAGNEGQGGVNPVHTLQVQVHAWGEATTTTPGVAGFLLAHDEGEFQAQGTVWFEEPLDLRIGMLVDGEPVWSDVVTAEDELETTFVVNVDGTDVEVGPVGVAGGQLPSGVYGFEFVVADADGDAFEAQQLFLISVEGDGRYDAFMETRSGGGFLTFEGGTATIDSRMTVGYPAGAQKVLAVGSHVTRGSWENDGTHVEYDMITGEPIVEGALSAFSSRGPTRRPDVTGNKPEITAPGELILSVLSQYAPEQDPARVFPGGYVLMQGTSMAAPAVTGAVALMLQADPTLTPADIRVAWEASAVMPDGGEPTDWGFGKMDAFAAVQQVAPADGADDTGGTTGDAGGGTAAGGTGGDGGDGSTGGDDAGQSGGNGGGCGCTTGDRGGAPAAALLGVVLLGLRRRRR